ncbi:hypothetical protein SKAU_G00103530, partial [Synaphobranchus kaupii]
AQHRDAFVQERYGRYDLSDPFLALQRDSEAARGQSPDGRGPGDRAGPAACPNPLAVLKLVMAHCKRMQEKMMGQLAAAESRHRKVITDLEEEKRRHAQDSAEGDDVTYMLEKERERLLQQLGFERAQVKRLEKEQKKLWGQAEQERQRASAQAQEEGQRVAELGRRLEEECGAAEALRGELEAERRRAQQNEARAERQLAEFDTEREQLRARLRREEGRSRQLREEVEGLRKEMAALGSGGGGGGGTAEVAEGKVAAVTVTKAKAASGSSETDGGEKSPSRTPAQLRVNGHHVPKEGEASPENGLENGILLSPVHPHPHPHPSLSPCSTASSSLTSSPCSSPILAKRLVGVAATSPGYQSSYQAGVNQRFHAARHKFLAQAEHEQHQQGGGSGPHSPRDLSPTTTPAAGAQRRQAAGPQHRHPGAVAVHVPAGRRQTSRPQQLALRHGLPKPGFPHLQEPRLWPSVSRRQVPHHPPIREGPPSSDTAQKAGPVPVAGLPHRARPGKPLPRTLWELRPQQQPGGCQRARPSHAFHQLTANDP